MHKDCFSVVMLIYLFLFMYQPVTCEMVLLCRCVYFI